MIRKARPEMDGMWWWHLWQGNCPTLKLLHFNLITIIKKITIIQRGKGGYLLVAFSPSSSDHKETVCIIKYAAGHKER